MCAFYPDRLYSITLHASDGTQRYIGRRFDIVINKKVGGEKGVVVLDGKVSHLL
jgi:hypothetical protein